MSALRIAPSLGEMAVRVERLVTGLRDVLMVVVPIAVALLLAQQLSLHDQRNRAEFMAERGAQPHRDDDRPAQQRVQADVGVRCRTCVLAGGGDADAADRSQLEPAAGRRLYRGQYAQVLVAGRRPAGRCRAL